MVCCRDNVDRQLQIELFGGLSIFCEAAGGGARSQREITVPAISIDGDGEIISLILLAGKLLVIIFAILLNTSIFFFNSVN